MEPRDIIALDMLTLHGARDTSENDGRRRVFFVRLLGDDIVHASRTWITSPNLSNVTRDMKPSAPMDHPSFPITCRTMENIQSAQIVLPCVSLNETVAFFKDLLGFQVDTIFPADDPSVVIISGYGTTIRLERHNRELSQSPVTLRLLIKNESDASINGTKELVAPNGTKIQLVELNSKLFIPPNNQSFVISQVGTNSNWIAGRAGMNYRDLIPGRQGGRFIASHIRIPDGGPVADNVHYHNIRFQMIYVYKGWVRVVYEDQGEDFILNAGDCVLQPPLIRHRVLESSPGLEVIEVACPAVHDTHIDHTMGLPNKIVVPNREFSGQVFVKYIHGDKIGKWKSWRLGGFEYQDTGIGIGTGYLADVKIVRIKEHIQSNIYIHQAEFVFIFILSGQLSLRVNDENFDNLTGGDAFVLPENLPYTFSDCSNDLRLLEVSLPAHVPTAIL